MNELQQQVYRYRIGVSADTKKKISDIGSAEKTCIGYALNVTISICIRSKNVLIKKLKNKSPLPPGMSTLFVST